MSYFTILYRVKFFKQFKKEILNIDTLVHLFNTISHYSILLKYKLQTLYYIKYSYRVCENINKIVLPLEPPQTRL